MTGEAPVAAGLVSVVVPTRNRAESLARAVDSLLALDDPSYEVWIVDQSDGAAAGAALGERLDDQRLRILESRGSGSALARNEGIRVAGGELVALVDDDCEVPAGWLGAVRAAFAADERIGVVYGNVVAAAYDPAAGWTPGFERRSRVVARGRADRHRIHGISACMGLRRAAWEELGGFDEMLGSGAPLRSGAESDLAFRALGAGWHVSEDPAIEVIHHGFRPWRDALEVMDRYWYGTGAMLAKNLRREGVATTAPYLARLARGWVAGGSPVARSLPRPYRWRRLRRFLAGMAAGARRPFDRESGHFTGGA